MREHDEGRKPRLAQFLHCDGGARHLHQRENAFLHARTARSSEQDEGRLALHRGAHGGDDRLARARSEGAAEELEILRGGDNALTFQAPRAGDDRIGHAGLAARILEAIGVAAFVAKLEGIGRDLRQGECLVLTVVEQSLEPRGARHAHVIIRAGNDELVRLEILVIDHLPRLGAFHPQILRHLLPAKDVANLGSDDAIDPVHGLQNSQSSKSLELVQFTTAASAVCRKAEASRSTMPSTCGLVLRVALPSESRLCAMAATIAEPTTTPSATRASALTCSSVFTPKPTAIGKSVCV